MVWTACLKNKSESVKTCSESWFTIGQKTVSCLLRSYATFFTLTTEWRFITLIRFCCFLILELVFPCDGNPFDKSLHGCFSETILPKVGSFRIIRVHPRIKVGLQLFDRCIDFLSECDSIELILHGSVKSLTGIRIIFKSCCPKKGTRKFN